MRRLYEYRIFDAEAFLKDRKDWKAEKKKLEAKLASLPELPAVNNNTGVRSSEPSDPTMKLAMRRLQIASDIEEIEYCEDVYYYGMSKLTDEERDLIQRFFEPKKPIWIEVEDYTEKNYISRMTMYNRRRDVIRKFGQIIEEQFFK